MILKSLYQYEVFLASQWWPTMVAVEYQGTYPAPTPENPNIWLQWELPDGSTGISQPKHWRLHELKQAADAQI